jgi:HTH-type transcriptional regulator, sugar sensing transcriptional regulator
MKAKAILDTQTLELLGLTEKDLNVYVALLRLGTAPLRRTAEEAGYNRGTTYDALKRLLSAGMVSYVDAKSHRYFTAEDPQTLRGLATRKEVAIQEAQEKIRTLLPAFHALADSAKYRTAVRYYEGSSGVHDILTDVLATCDKLPGKTYRIYSSAKLRELIADAWPTFTATRVKRNIFVKAISLGPGGTVNGLDQRRWLSKSMSSSAYIFIYGKKTAYVSADKSGKLFGAVIDDENVTSTQIMIFDALWESLG